jgi:hypothetical protein
VFYPKFCSGESVTCCCTAMSDDPCGPSKSKSTGVLGKVQPSKCFNAPCLWNRKAIILGRRLHIVKSFSQISRKLSGFSKPHRASPRGMEVLQPLNSRNSQPDQNVRANHTGLQTESMSSSQRWRLTTIPRNGELVGLTVTCPKRDLPLNLTDKYSTFAGD